MANWNPYFQDLSKEYLFAQVAKRVSDYRRWNPQAEVISLGIGDVTLPLVPAVVEALQQAVEEMGREETFRGYAPDQGYAFLRELIAKEEYESRGTAITAEEIFISDGAKSDAANIQELFSPDSVAALCDPVYPVYLDSNVLAGRAGTYDPEQKHWKQICYLPCTADNGFVPRLPREGCRIREEGKKFSKESFSFHNPVPDIIYLCSPNNPTGTAMTKAQLQMWVDYANHTGAVIIYDGAYEAYIDDAQGTGYPHTIYECPGAATCAIEVRSFSKNAGFTGLRLGYTVVPKALKRGTVFAHDLWKRRQSCKFNGVSYIVQCAGAAIYTRNGKAQTEARVKYYRENAGLLRDTLAAGGYTVYGAVHAPYVWWKLPGDLASWEGFDRLLESSRIVTTPGSGFGICGEGYLRLSGFGRREDIQAACDRLRHADIISCK